MEIRQLSLFPEESGQAFSNTSPRKSKTTHQSTSTKLPKETKTTHPAAKKRSKPYIWVTWLSGLMAQEKQCQFTAWSLANYQFPKLPSDFDSSAHDKMVIQQKMQHQAQGSAVYVENDNSFTINGKTCDIGGKPDIVVNDFSQIVIEDCKSGKQKIAHKYQVLIYMLLFPLSPKGKALCQGQTPAGRLVYPDEIVEISPLDVDSDFKDFFLQTVAIISGSTPPTQAPSHWECRYCNVPGAYCPARIHLDADTGNHDFF
jgi:CRISPR/Cas system-associated exonuclease Cas4 (RecB family)